MKSLEEICEWSINAKRFVCFVDILGFKDMIFRKGMAYTKGVYNSIREFNENYLETLKKKMREDKADERVIKLKTESVRYIYFSDSLIYYTRGNLPFELEALLEYIGLLVAHLSALKQPIPIKAGISHGEFLANPLKSLYDGAALVKASETEEKNTYLGIICDQTVNEYFEYCKQIDPDAAERLKHFIIEIKTEINDKTEIIFHIPVINLIVEECKNDYELGIYKLWKQSSGKSRRYIDNTLLFNEIFKKNKTQN